MSVVQFGPPPKYGPRLEKEKKDFPIHGLRLIEIVEQAEYKTWRVGVDLNRFVKNNKLYEDMIKKGVKEVVLQLKIPGNYPFSPPDIYVESPHFDRNLSAELVLSPPANEPLQNVSNMKYDQWAPSLMLKDSVNSFVDAVVRGADKCVLPAN